MRPHFSIRQRELLYYLGQGKTCSEIATILGISVKTVSTHRARVLRKLDAENTAQLMRFAILEGVEL